MKEFLFIYRNAAPAPDQMPSPEQMQQMTAEWMTWLAGIAAQGKIADRGNRLSMAGAKTLRPGGVLTDGPYTEIKEFINGYTIVKAADIDEAAALAGGCPILHMGGNVEVRTIATMDDNG